MTSLPPTPWTLHDSGSAFYIKDANGRGLAYVYYKRDPALWGTYLKPDEARDMAIQIARLSKAND